MNKEKTSGIGVSGLLGVAFVILKLCKVINWSWWWVLSPFWIPVVVVIVLLIIYALFGGDFYDLL